MGMVAAAKRELEHYERALVLETDVGDRKLQGKCYGNLAIVVKNKGGPLLEAVKSQEDALRVARDLGDKRSEGRTLGNLGILQSCLGNKAAALPYYERPDRSPCDLGNQLDVGIWLHNYGEDAIESNPARAEEALRQAAEIFRRLDQQRHLLESESLLARVAARHRSV